MLIYERFLFRPASNSEKISIFKLLSNYTAKKACSENRRAGINTPEMKKAPELVAPGQK
jgi:hypothetical protein